MRLILCGLVAALAILEMQANGAPAEKKTVKPLSEWFGSVADEKLEKTAPQVVVSEKAWAELWKQWQAKGEAPEVDFTKHFVLVVTTRGSRLMLSARLDDDGNLDPLAIATRDLRPGFRYILAVFPREGVKKVDGKELPKE